MNIEIMKALKLDYCFCDNETVNNLISANCSCGLQVSSSKDASRVPYYSELDETITPCQAVEPMIAPSWNHEHSNYSPPQQTKIYHQPFFIPNYTTSNSSPNSFEFPKPKVRFDCSYPGCGKPFRSQEARDKHQKFHYKLRTHMCHICDKSYTQNGNLIKHMKTHSVPDVEQRRTHQCQYCDRKYTEKYNLKVHQKKFHPVEFVQLYGS
ncbi:unnamed protein product [Moneuplotes crassus]|uniref:C2H2-type domain-containing protein n=1 Tax=Euplotes crassus TaxID=5936 RepID=A0AAD1USW9_EUPCR|nr:unnamed protein product [Moneuplotes crassus]